MERTQFFINTMVKNRLIKNKSVIHSLTAFAIIGEISGKSVCVFTKYIKEEFCKWSNTCLC